LFESRGALHVTFEGPTVSSEAEIEVPPESTEDAVTEPIPVSPTEPPKKNQIFVVHGKNRTPLKQLKVILDKFKIPYKVAMDEPHKGRPISKKVAELMRECTSAIIIFTADELYLDADSKEIWKPSDNAVYELGAASILYDKIVILKEDRVTLASDFKDIGYISFEKDKLNAEAMGLITEFIGFGIVEIIPK
jgi:predicted nucleotide-binding protein